MKWPILIASLWLTLACADAPAQKVYRCGPGGREYSQAPCPVGRELGVGDPRSAEQQRDAREAAEKQARLARELAGERRAREAAARGLGPAGIKPIAPPVPAASAAHKGAGKKKKHEKKPAIPVWKATSLRP